MKKGAVFAFRSFLQQKEKDMTPFGVRGPRNSSWLDGPSAAAQVWKAAGKVWPPVAPAEVSAGAAEVAPALQFVQAEGAVALGGARVELPQP